MKIQYRPLGHGLSKSAEEYGKLKASTAEDRSEGKAEQAEDPSNGKADDGGAKVPPTPRALAWAATS